MSPAGDERSRPAGQGDGAPLNEMGAQFASSVLGGVGLGDLRLTGWFSRYGRKRALEALGRGLGELRPRVAPIKGYDAAWDVLGDSVIGVSGNPGREAEVHVQLRQTDVEGLGWRGARRLVVFFETAGDRWQASRLDLNVDVPDGPDPQNVVLAALVDKDAVTRVKKVHGNCELDRVTGKLRFTTYVGARQSERMLRVYCADGKHPELASGTTRFELELKAETATQLVRTFLGVGDVPKLAVDRLRPLFWSIVRGLVDFVARKSAAHPEDCKPLSWWATIVDQVPKAAAVPPRTGAVVQVRLARTMQWARRQWAVSLAYIGRELGAADADRFVEDLVVEGGRRLDRLYGRHYGDQVLSEVLGMVENRSAVAVPS